MERWSFTNDGIRLRRAHPTHLSEASAASLWGSLKTLRRHRHPGIETSPSPDMPPYDWGMSAARSTNQSGLPHVFIGSSTEGLEIGRHLQLDLERTGTCIVTRWDQGVFQASTYTIHRLEEAARRADFAILIATADDTVTTRGESQNVARDNVIFELGLFIGSLGLERTFIVADRTEDLQLPSDLAGLTWLPYANRQDGNVGAAVNEAVLGATSRIKALGKRGSGGGVSPLGNSGVERPLDAEIERICSAALAQGWRVRTNSGSTLRLQDRSGRKFTFSIGEADSSREQLRSFAADLRANGLRVSRSVRQPVEDSPLSR